MDPQLEKEIERLRQSKVEALQERYRELFGEESPSGGGVVSLHELPDFIRLVRAQMAPASEFV